MKKRKFVGLFISLIVIMMLLVVTGCNDSANKKKEEYVIGWSTIYLTPTWMQQTNEMLEERSDYWNDEGIKHKLVVANANGDTSAQVSQIENMISKKYDAIIVVAGSSTALNPVIEKAVDAGITVIGFDSLPSTDKITSTINTDTKEWGKLTAEWLVEQVDGSGKIIAMNGPAGVSVSEERWEGAKEVFDQYPEIEIVANLNTEYNEGPALEAILPTLDANKDVAGIFSQGGAFSSAALKALDQKNMDLVPITGENYNGYLKQWFDLQEKGFSSFALGQPNWLVVLSLDQAIRDLEGYSIKEEVIVSPPVIDDANLGDFLPNDESDDYFIIEDITDEEIEDILGPMEK